MLGLPETENELDNLTEFNTAQNRRISMMGIPKEETFIKKRRKIHITFNDEEDVINPWDVDPSIGRFTNLVQSTVIPKANKQQTQVNSNQYLFLVVNSTLGLWTWTSTHHGAQASKSDRHFSKPTGNSDKIL